MEDNLSNSESEHKITEASVKTCSYLLSTAEFALNNGLPICLASAWSSRAKSVGVVIGYSFTLLMKSETWKRRFFFGDFVFITRCADTCGLQGCKYIAFPDYERANKKCIYLIGLSKYLHLNSGNGKMFWSLLSLRTHVAEVTVWSLVEASNFHDCNIRCLMWRVYVYCGSSICFSNVYSTEDRIATKGQSWRVLQLHLSKCHSVLWVVRKNFWYGWIRT